VITSAAGGLAAAAAINADLVSEDTELAVAAYRKGPMPSPADLRRAAEDMTAMSR
jgi:hypothetical protein